MLFKQLFGEKGFILTDRNRFTCFFSMCGQCKLLRLENLRIFFALAAFFFLKSLLDFQLVTLHSPRVTIEGRK